MSQSLKIKICGMTDAANLKEVAALHPNAVGIIFAPLSPRCLKGSHAFTETLNALDVSICKIGVFQNQTFADVSKIIREYSLSGAQLHGDESIEFCQELREHFPKLILIKAFGISDTFDFSQLQFYKNIVDYLLFDTQSVINGGSGKKFNWDLLKKYSGSTPFFLSGGLGVEESKEMKNLSQKYPSLIGVDANSRLEISPGLKSVAQVAEFIRGVRS